MLRLATPTLILFFVDYFLHKVPLCVINNHPYNVVWLSRYDYQSFKYILIMTFHEKSYIILPTLCTTGKIFQKLLNLETLQN